MDTISNYIRTITEKKQLIEYIRQKLTYNEITHTFYSTTIRLVYGETVYNELLKRCL